MAFPFTPLFFTQDQSGNFYLIDKETFEIVSTDPGGRELRRASGNGFGPSELIDPAILLWRGMLLYVLDRGAKSVKLFDRMLNFRGERKLAEIFQTARIADPASMTVNAFGEIFITDRLNHTILAADQSFSERNDVFFIENMPGKKLQFPLDIISGGDYIAVRDSSGIFLFDRFLNFLKFFELQTFWLSAGITNDNLILTGKNELMIINMEIKDAVAKIYKLRADDEKGIHSPSINNNRLLFISGKEIKTVNLDSIRNEQ